MSETLYVVPAAGKEVAAELYGVPPEGKRVPKDSFWTRRVKFGDVELGTPPQPRAEPAPPPKPAPTAKKAPTPDAPADAGKGSEQ